MKKRVISLVLTISLTFSFLVVPTSAASSGIGVTSSLDTGAVASWTSYFKGDAIRSSTVSTGQGPVDFWVWAANYFEIPIIGVSFANYVSRVCWKIIDLTVDGYGLGEVSMAQLNSICASYQSSFGATGSYFMRTVFHSVANYTWWGMFGKTPKFVIDDKWGTSGIYRIKEEVSGLYVCNSKGQYVWADVGATVVSSDSSDKSSYQWIGDRTASDRAKNGKVQIILESNFLLLQDQLRREGTSNYAGALGSEYKCIWNGLRQVLANANGDPIVYRVYKAPYIINEEPRTPAEENESEIITDPSYFVDQDGNWHPTESLIYDNSTHSYISNTYTYNIDNRSYEYKTWNIDYHINYTYIYNIGQSEVLEEYTQYYKLPDGRSSADLTKEELEQLNLNMDVINYQVVNDASSLLGLWHLDGDLRDSSFYGSDADFLRGSSVTYLDSGAFNGSLYIPSMINKDSGSGLPYFYPSQLIFGTGAGDFNPSTDDWTLEFRVKVTPTGSNDPALSVDVFDSGGTTSSSNMAPGIFKLSGASWGLYDTSGYCYAATSAAYGVWNHIALERSGDVLSLYVNGAFAGACSASVFPFDPDSVLIYMRFDSYKAAYEIDEVRLSAEALWEGSFIVPSVPYDTNLVLVLPDVDDDTEVAALSSANEAFPVDALAGSPAYESLSALSSDVIATYNEADGEYAIAPYAMRGILTLYLRRIGGFSSDQFKITLECSSPLSGTFGSFTFDNGTATRLLSIPLSDKLYSYRISGTGSASFSMTVESLNSNYVLSYPETVYVDESTTTTAVISCTYVPPVGSLVISNSVSGTGQIDEFTYTVTLGDTTYSENGFTNGVRTLTLSSDQSITLNDLPVTTYTVTQEAPANYTVTSTGTTGEIADGSTAVAAFTNTALSVPLSQSIQITNPILAIKSQTPVKDYQIGGVRPTYPSIGLVWALVENGYITSIQIYTGYAWEACDARIWTGSRWIPYNYFNVITLMDMYDIVDASGNQGYEYLYTESGFWNWWQRAWTDFVKLFQNTKFGGSSVTENTDVTINSDEYASGDVTVVEAVSDSGKGLWSILKGIFGVVGNVFSESGSIGNAFEVTFNDSGGEDSAFYIFDVPLEQMSPTG